MSDELPTEERLRRIERGVQRRIDARRATAQRIARGVTGGVVAVLLIGGGFALLRPVTGTATGSSGASGGGSVAAVVPVTCHGDGGVAVVRADRSRLPASALSACTTPRFSGAVRPNAAGAPTASSTPPAGVLCRAKDGALHVYPGATASCRAHGMTPYPG